MTFTVGQEVILHDVNEGRLGGPVKGTITKVGRKLVTIKGDSWWSESQYRMDDQTRNDGLGHSWFATLEQEATRLKLEDDWEVIGANGFRPNSIRIPNERVHAVADLLRSLDTTQHTS